MKVIKCLQYSPEWWALRRGIPTASEFGRIITPAKGEYAEAADKYMAEILASALGWSSSFGGNDDTERGNLLEPKALKWLAMSHGIDSEPVGFVLSDCGTYGASPDAIVKGERTPVEVKSPDLHTFFGWKKEMMKTKEMPRCHKAQVHGEIFTCEADHGYFVAYAHHPSVRNIVVRVERDSFTDKIGPYLKRFNEELRELEAAALEDDVAEYREGLEAGRLKAIKTTHPEPEIA